MMYGSPYGHRRGKNFLGLNRPSKLTKGSMYGRDEF